MRILIRYFAAVRERLKRDEEELTLPEGVTVATALEILATAHDPVRTLRPYLRVAVNQSFADVDQILADGDELALIPPVAGGSTSAQLFRVVTNRPPSVEAVQRAVSGPDMGGVVTFVGLVRAQSMGRVVERLEYEAYIPMAEKVFSDIAQEITAKNPGVRIALEHRIGVLHVGDVAVAIAAAAPHRAEAFRACAEMIDRLKERAPIWKKEVGPDDASWVGLGP